MTRVHLVSCVKAKADRPLPAGALYTSNWFRKARAFVEAQGTAWWVLSAKHGLIGPMDVIEPYELSLYDLTRDQRKAWGERVSAQLAEALPADATVVILAGQVYRQHLTFGARKVEVPMANLSIGEQLRWLTLNRYRRIA